MNDEEFQKAYKSLNKEQKEAVDAIDGPVMVIAGPGTGKTQILTLRIANILRETDTRPENILAITLTESGVQSMRKRLLSIMGSEAYRVNIGTFHGFCNNVIKDYPEYFPRIIGAKNINEVDQVSIIENIIETEDLELLRPYGDPLLYVKPIIKAINDLKREGVGPEEFEKICKKSQKVVLGNDDLKHTKGPHKGKIKGDYQKQIRKIEKNIELARVYGKYEEALEEGRLYDYSDMIVETLKTLKAEPDLLQLLQEEYQYVLVDEHQDTNNAQNKVLELLLNFHDNPNIFIVGDDKQAIFRFQGASIANFYYFRKLYKDAVLINLAHNYRSTQSILDSAHAVLPGDVKLKANAGYPEKPITILSFKSEDSEHLYVAEEIKEKIESGVEPSEIAVLYRDNADVLAIARDLRAVGVPHIIESDQDLLSFPEVKKMLAILEAIHHYGEEEYLAQLLSVDFIGVHPMDMYKLFAYAKDTDKKVYEILENEKSLKAAGVNAEILRELAKKLSRWVTLSKNADAGELFSVVVRESGVLNNVFTEGAKPHERLAALEGLLAEIETLLDSHPGSTLSDFMLYLETVKTHDMRITGRQAGEKEGRVRLMTAHKSKGQEFEYVYIIDAYEGHFGGKRNIDKLSLIPEVFLGDNEELSSDAKDMDERRLFYVALTRAKKHAVISYSLFAKDGKERLPSSFISDIYPELVESRNVEDAEKDLREKKISMLREEPKEQFRDYQEFIKERFDEHGLSVSALNNYLKCPWRYFFRNLIRISEKRDPSMLYGTAVHETFKEALKAGEKVSDEKLLIIFEKYLKRAPLSDKDFTESLKKGRNALPGFYKKYLKNAPKGGLLEFKIKGIDIGGVTLSGILDRVDILDGADVKVIDYKTGRAKSRNSIIGATKDSDGDYYRQLVFYKLLLGLYEDGKYKMKEGEIQFVEPSEAGEYKSEVFEIPDSDVSELKETILKVAKEITSASFWSTSCDDKDCTYCALRGLSI